MSERQKRLLLCLALMASVGVYIALASVIDGGRQQPRTDFVKLHTPVTIAAGVLIVACALRALTGLTPSTPERAFLANMVVALALAEAVVIGGFVLLLKGLSFAGFLPFALAALGAQVFFVLPRALR